MPIVTVNMVEGRSSEMKRALIREVTDAVEKALQAPRKSIRVIIQEVPPEHWGVAGEPKSR